AVLDYVWTSWTAWSGPGSRQPEAALDRLTEIYSKPGAFTASIGWYRSGSGTVASSLVETPPSPLGRISVDTRILWPEHDPLFPLAWGDRVTDFFSHADLRTVPGVGHFVPLEASHDFASTIRELSTGRPKTQIGRWDPDGLGSRALPKIAGSHLWPAHCRSDSPAATAGTRMYQPEKNPTIATMITAATAVARARPRKIRTADAMART